MAPRILVVEDNMKNRVLARDILRHFGYEVLEAGNGAEGVAMATAELPELILMDIQMPVLNGLEAMKRLKGNDETRGLKIVAVTAFAMKGDREMFLDAGFDGYIQKPIDPVALPDIVKEFLEQ